MENYNKILELLEKKNLTPEEEKLLDSFQKDEQASLFISGYREVKQALKVRHISVDEMADYILFSQNNEPEDKLISYRIPAIEAHLKKCKTCSDQLKELQNEYSDIENFVGQNLYADKDSKSQEQIKPGIFRRNYAPVYAFASIVLIGIIYIAMLAVSGLTTPDHYKYGSIDEDSEVYLTRGRATDDFLRSFEALENEDYSTAVTYLKDDIKNNSSDETIFYSHYVLGLTYLEMSESRFLGMFPSYDETTVREGLNSLMRSVDLNNSGRFENVKFDAYFYIAKGNLMLNNKKAAEEYLQRVIDHKGSRMSDAAKILNELE